MCRSIRGFIGAGLAGTAALLAYLVVFHGWAARWVAADKEVPRAMLDFYVAKRPRPGNENRDDETRLTKWTQELEEKRLESRARSVTRTLVALLVGSLAISAGLLSVLTGKGAQSTSGLRTILLYISAGVLGSSVTATISAVDRISHGRELSDGTKVPKSASERDMFVKRMVPWFLARPVLGVAMGFLVYVGVASGYLIAVVEAGQAQFSPLGLAFLSLLGGLMAKIFFEELRAVFKNLFGA